MEAAIAAARETMARGAGGPFGACIVKDGQILATSGNRVLELHDPTAHAEVNAIRMACSAAHSHLLQGAEIYSTTEPCPMCFAAIHWAQIATVIFGTHIADVARLGFNELPITNEAMNAMGGSPIRLIAGYMEHESRELLESWAQMGQHITY